MCINCHILNLSVNLDGLELEFKRVAELIHNGKLQPGQIDSAMTKTIAKQLLQSFWEGYGDSTDMPESFVKHIERNIWVFSGFKNHAQLSEARDLLLDGDGGFKDFNAWFRDIKGINDTYNETYAKAEHANVLASSQAIASWNDFKANGIERLRFETAGDSRVRPEHAILDGTVVSIDDPMLDKYYTPLDWGCRCEWVPAVDEDLTGWGDLPHVPPMFKTNVAKTGVIFPDTHPYFDVPKDIKDKVVNQVNEMINNESKPAFEPKGIADYERKLGIKINRDIFKNLDPETKFTSSGKGAYYLPDSNTVNIPVDARRKKSKAGAEKVVYHEFGHALDWQNDFRKSTAVKSLMDKYRAKYRGALGDLSDDVYKKGYNAHLKDDHDTVEEVGALADTIMSLNYNFGFGHSKAYFQKPYMSEAEFIAHAFENRFAGNKVFKSFMPDLYEDMITLVDGFFKP